jgi:hypothetical protein
MDDRPGLRRRRGRVQGYRSIGSLFEAKRHELFTISTRTFTSGIFQKWIRQVNPANRFDSTAALIQFVLSNQLIDAALVGMRTPEEVDANVAAWRDEASRIDVTEPSATAKPSRGKGVRSTGTQSATHPCGAAGASGSAVVLDGRHLPFEGVGRRAGYRVL